MTNVIDTEAATGARRSNRAAVVHRWLARAWASIRTAATDHSVQWQSTLLSRRKLTHPSEVMKMREPVRPTTRATWYR